MSIEKAVMEIIEELAITEGNEKWAKAKYETAKASEQPFDLSLLDSDEMVRLVVRAYNEPDHLNYKTSAEHDEACAKAAIQAVKEILERR